MTIFTAGSPGPDVLYIASNSLSGNWKKGTMAWMGVMTATVMYVFATALGLSVLFQQAPIMFDVVKWFGIFYLAYLGMMFLKSAFLDTKQLNIEKQNNNALRSVFAKGFLITLFNPKTILFFTALLPQFVNIDNGFISLQLLILGLSATLVGQTIYGLYTVFFVFVGRKIKKSENYSKNTLGIKILNGFCGVIYLTFSFSLVSWQK